MIGGFGNLTGEIDFWSLEKLTQLGSTKSYCAVDIEWAADGMTLMTSVLYWRVKVDNAINFFASITSCERLQSVIRLIKSSSLKRSKKIEN